MTGHVAPEYPMIKDVIRLKWQADLSHEQIASTLNISKGAVTNWPETGLPSG
jgi:DNA-binding transcriptional regulator YiaG